MVANSKIEWCKNTFNPWIGCTKVGPGCDHCYAETWNARWQHANWGPENPRRRTAPKNWAKPPVWNKQAGAAGERHRVFCASLADVFDNHASIEPSWRTELGTLVNDTPNLDWLFLTKRIGRAHAVLPTMFPTGVPSNLWLGATVVTAQEWMRDVPKLLNVKKEFGLSTVFLSCEPLIEPLPVDAIPEATQKGGIDWVIVGGESGPGARFFDAQWARDMHAKKGHMAFFMKQMGGVKKPFADIPPDIFVREFPS